MNNLETIENYAKIMCDLLLLFENSEISKLDNAAPNLYNGINIITHIFHMSLHKPTDRLLYACRKACFCYFEYIDQIRKSEITKNLPISDIATFLLKQTESDPTDKDWLVTEPQHNNLVKTMKYIMHILMAWGRDIDLKVRVVICSSYLAEYCKTFSEYPDNLDCINCIIQKITMPGEIYYHFLGAYYKWFLKHQKKGRTTNNDIIEIYSYLQEHSIYKLDHETSVDTFIHNLYK